MKLEEFNAKLIENIFLGAYPDFPYDSTLFLDQQQDEIRQIAGITDFDIIHIELPHEGILCDGYSIDENLGKLSVMIGDITKNKNQVEIITDDEIKILIEKGKSFVNNVFQNTIRKMIDESEEDQQSAIDQIFESHLRIENINFFIITNKTYHSEDDAIAEGAINNISYTSLVISLIDFYELWKSKSLESVTPDIDFEALGYKLPFIKLSQEYEDYDGYLAVMNAKALFDIYDEHETDLLQGNVRFFLNATRKQNKGLIETLENDRQKFFAYNNGISATANAIKFFEEDGIKYIKTVDNLQIVNGGQTTATIHFFGKKNKNNLKLLEDVFLQMKLNVITNDINEKTFVHDISRYANTQSAVTFSDLDANDSFNINIENYSRKICIPGSNGEKWFFERKTGDYFTTGLNLETRNLNKVVKFKNEFKKTRIIKKTELALLLFAWGFFNNENRIEPRPYDSALGAEKNYDKFKKYRSNNLIHVDTQFYTNSISKVILARKLALLVTEANIKQQRNHVVNYTIALMSLLCNGVLNFNYLWEKQDISPELSKSLSVLVQKVWEAIVESAGPINLGTWCRKAECWMEVKKIHHSFSKNIPEIISENAGDDNKTQLTNDEKKVSERSDNLNRRLSFEESLFDSGFWFGLAKWAKDNKVLDGRSRKFSFQVGTLISRKLELSLQQKKWAMACFNEVCSKGYNNPQTGNDQSKYLKLICKQDIERTPSVSIDSIEDFFEIDLKKGEACMVELFFNSKKYSVELNKRNTRNEYRLFLNRIREEIGYDVDDILEFTKNKTGYYVKIIKKDDLKYDAVFEAMKGKLHFIRKID